MRNLVVGTFLTLDGVMQAPGGPRRGYAFTRINAHRNLYRVPVP